MNSKISKIDILPEHNLLRRYIYPNPPNASYIKEDGKICSTCFQLRPDELGISVDIEVLTTYEKSINDRTKYRLLCINAGEVQLLNLNTEHNPEPDNYAHALITGNITKSISRKLAALAKRVKYPD